MTTETNREEIETMRRQSEDVRRRAATTLRRFGIVEASDAAEQQKIDALCEQTFKQVAQLSCQQRRTAEEAQQIFAGIDWDQFPAVRSYAIRHYFSDPAKMAIEPSRAYQESTRLRLAADREIVALFEALHRELRKFEPRVIDTRPFPERLRQECFQEVARLSGQTEKEVARVFGRINWSGLRSERYREVERELCPEVPALDFDRRDTPKSQGEYTRQQQAIRNRILAERYAEEAMRQIILLLQNLHGDLAAHNTVLIAKRNQVAQVQKQIERLSKIAAA